MGQPVTAALPDPSSTADPPEPPTSVMNVNLTGTYYTTFLALHYFRTHPSATSTKQLIFISSLLAYIEAPLVLDYNASKHGVRGFWRSIVGEAEALGIKGTFRCNLVAPNLVKTPMTKDFVQWMIEERGFSVAEVEDLVGVLSRVVSDESVSGKFFSVCGTDIWILRTCTNVVNTVGRAIGCFSDGVAVDLCDDFEGHDGGRESLKLVESGLLGPGPSKWGRYRMMD
jgi:NAD(P)-dependent dehydrogenase (short-subunit alcohol dehydrogenase family)